MDIIAQPVEVLLYSGMVYYNIHQTVLLFIIAFLLIMADTKQNTPENGGLRKLSPPYGLPSDRGRLNTGVKKVTKLP